MDRKRDAAPDDFLEETEDEDERTPENGKERSRFTEFKFDDILMEDTESKDTSETDEEPARLSEEQEEKQYRKERRRKAGKTVSGVLSWVKEIAVTLVIVWFILTFVAQNNRVSGTSMQPTVFANDTVIVNKFIYRFQKPERGDIIIFPTLESDGKKVLLIKRIIGLPGDSVDIKDGAVYVNDILLEEDYIDVETEAVDGQVVFPITVPEDEYFVLGDNRPVSKDSRWLSVGTVTKKDIVGKVSIRIWPLDEIGFLN